MAENVDRRSPIQDPLQVPSSGDASNNQGQGKKSRRDRRRNNNNNRRAGASSTRFQGACDELKDHVFDPNDIRGGAELFTKTTKAIAEYVAREYTSAGEFRTALPSLHLPGLNPPSRPDPGDPFLMEEWKIEYREYKKKIEDRRQNMQKIYALILGQCSPTIRDRIEASDEWETINNASNPISLLRTIRQSFYHRATRRKDTHALLEAELALHKFRQTERMSNSDYLEKLRELVEVYEHLGGEPGCSEVRVNARLVDPEMADEDEIREAKIEAREEYLAVTLLFKSDPRRYANLVADIENQYTRGQDGYPSTLSAAYDMLINYRNPASSTRLHGQDSGMAFAQASSDGVHQDLRDGDNGRGARGRSAGRGRHGGRGRGRGRNVHERGDDHILMHSEEAHTQQVEPNLDIMDTPYLSSHRDCVLASSSTGGKPLPQRWILLDSCSSANLISDRTLLHSVHQAARPLVVHCNAGTVTLTEQGYFGSYPEPVWYNPSGLANIMSLNNISKYYQLTMDTMSDAAILLHKADGSSMRFIPSGNGLYHYALKDDIDTWVMVTTVAERADKYSQRAIQGARTARRFQNIVMRPGKRDMMDIAITHLRDCPIKRSDIAAAEDIFGPNLGSLKGKTVWRPNPHVAMGIDGVPPEIIKVHRSLILAMDIMFINKIAFFVTTSRNLKFGTVEALPNRQIPTIIQCLKSVIALYRHRGFEISAIMADNEFEAIRPQFPMLNCAAANEHVPEVERFIRTIKDRVRSTYRMLPYRRIPRTMLIHLTKNSVFWLNAFPARDGVSSKYSPRYIMTGQELSYSRHVQLEFGEYVQTHEEHNNEMMERTLGAICLGPTGNQQGSHWFLSLSTGARIVRHRWTRLPLPREAIIRVNDFGLMQSMPLTLTFADRHGHELEDRLVEIDDDDTSDAEYIPNDDNEDDSDTYSYDSDDSSDDDDFPDANIEVLPHDPDGPAFGVAPDDDDDVSTQSQSTHGGPDHPEHRGMDHDNNPDNESCSGSEVDGTSWQAESHDNEQPDANAGVGEDLGPPDVQGSTDDNTGVQQEDEPPTLPTQQSHENTGVQQEDQPPTLSDIFEEAADIGRLAASQHDNTHNLRRDRKGTRDPNFQYMITTFQDLEPEAAFTLLMGDDSEQIFNFLTEQMSAKRGLQQFGEAGADAIKKELEQLVYRKVMQGRSVGQLTTAQKKAALRYLMFLKQKRCGRIKGRGCADGRKQRLWKSKEETSSPTISVEALFITCLIDAKEGRDIATCDVPSAFMHADIDEVIHLCLDGEIAELLLKVDPSYAKYATKEKGKTVIFTELSKALYGTLQAALLFWKNLTSFLVDELGFAVNPYDWCVVNKIINGKQCTVGWHVDDLKISHQDSQVVDDILHKLNGRYGKESPLVVTRGRVHEYLGMKMDFTTPGKVILSMPDYIDTLTKEIPSDLRKGASTTPAAGHLFSTNADAEKLNEDQASEYHHLVAKILYLAKRARPDLLLAVSFLCTRVTAPDIDDWKKLGRCLRYLHETKELTLTLSSTDLSTIFWWVDASFGVHEDCRSHTGAVMMMNHGALFALSSKQKLNTRSSTEAELVSVNDAMTMILRMKHFLEAQGYPAHENIIYQDNESSMKLEKYGRQSSGKKTRHLDIRYYFITDNVKKGTVQVRYCPTGDMVADFFTKPLQGSLFKKFRDQILNLPGTPHAGAHATSDNGGQECVGAYNVTGVRRCHGNHQSRMSDDDSTEHVEGHQLRTHQNTCLNVRTR